MNSNTPTLLSRLSGWARLVTVALILGFLALMAWGLVQAATGPRETGMAPDFSLTTFEGKTITLSELRGQVVVINIFRMILLALAWLFITPPWARKPKRRRPEGRPLSSRGK